MVGKPPEEVAETATTIQQAGVTALLVTGVQAVAAALVTKTQAPVTDSTPMLTGQAVAAALTATATTTTLELAATVVFLSLVTGRIDQWAATFRQMMVP